MSTSNKRTWYLGDDARDLDYLRSVVGEGNIIPMLRLEEAPSKAPALLVIDVDGVTDWEHQLLEVDLDGAKVALVSSASMSQVFIRSMYGDSPLRWYLGRLVSGTLPDSFVRALGACLHGENEILKLELSDLKRRLSTLEVTMESSTANELEWQRQISESSAKISELQSDRDQLAKEVSDSESRNSLIEEKLSTTERSLLDSREAGDHSRQLVTDVQEELLSLRTNNSTLSQNLEEKSQINEGLAQLLDDNKAAVERLRGLNGDLADKLEASAAEVLRTHEKLQEETDKATTALESEASAKLGLAEANEMFLAASQERETAESHRDIANNAAAEAVQARVTAEALAEKSAAEASESNDAAIEAKREAAASALEAETAKENYEKAIGESEARTLEAYGILSDRTEALEEECLLAATLGQENDGLKEQIDKIQSQLVAKGVELNDASLLASELVGKLDEARDEVLVATESASESGLRADAAEQAKSASLEQAETAEQAKSAALEQAETAEQAKSAALEQAETAEQAKSAALEQAEAARESESTSKEKMSEALVLVEQTILDKNELESTLEGERASLVARGLECKELTIRVQTVSDEFTAAVKAQEETISELKFNYDQKIASVSAAGDLALSESKKELEQSLSRAAATAADQLSNQAEENMSELEALKESYGAASIEQLELSRERLDVQGKEHIAVVTELESKHSQAIAQLGVEGESALADLSTTHEGEISTLRHEMASLVEQAEQAEASREAASAMAELTAKERDEADVRSDIATRVAAVAEKLANEAKLETADAKTSNNLALADLAQLKDSSKRIQIELQEQIEAAALHSEKQAENVDNLKGELLEKSNVMNSVIEERDKLAIEVSARTTELEEQAELALKRTVEFEYLQHENREVSTKLVALESIQAQHISELEVLRRDLDSAEFSYKEAVASTETVLSNMSELEERFEKQSHDNKEMLAQLSANLEKERVAALQTANALESELLAAQQQNEQLDSANTEAVMEIAKLRSRQSNTPQVVRPPVQKGKGAVVPSDIGTVDDVDLGHAVTTDSRSKRLEEELAEANSRLRATASGVVWSARREPDEKEGLLGRLKGTIRRNGDS